MDLGNRKFIGGSGAYKKLAKDDTFSSWSKGFMKVEEDRLLALQEEQDRKAAKAEQDKKDKAEKDKPKNILEWISNEGQDIIGTTGKNLAHFGSTIFNDVTTGFNEEESKKRTEDFMRTSGINNWDARQSNTGDFVGGLLGGLPEAIYNPAKQTTRDIVNVAESSAQYSRAEDARQALQNWRDNPNLMRKTLKGGQTQEEKIKELNEIIKKNTNTAEQKYVQEMDPLKTAGNAALNVINIGTLGTGSLLWQGGKQTAEQLVKGAAKTGLENLIKTATNLGKDNFTRKVIADTALGVGQAGAQSAADGTEIDPKDAGIATALALLTHAKSGIRARKQQAELQAKEEAAQRGKDFVAGKDASMADAQAQLDANAASQQQFRLPAVTDTAKMSMRQRIADIDAEQQKLASNDPEYLKEQNLMDIAAGDKRFKELTTEDPTNMAAQKEASKAVEEADQQIKYYNKLNADSPYHRQLNRAEDSRKQELGQLELMVQNGDVDPAGARSIADEVNAKWDEKLQELANKYPEDASQKPILDQAIEQVTQQRIAAQDNLDSVVADQRNAAFKEADSIRNTPSAELMKKHSDSLNEERAQLEAKLKEAEDFTKTPNTSEAQVDKELAMLDEGSHPAHDGGNVTQTREKLLKQKTAFQEAKILEEQPGTKLTRADKDRQRRVALEEATNAIETPNNRKPLMMDLLELPSEYLRHRGLNELADLYDDSVLKVNAANYDDAKMLKSWQKMAKGQNKQTMFKAANGDMEAYNKLSPAGKEVIDLWRQTAKKWGRELGLPEEVLDKPYISHIIVDDTGRARLLKLSDQLHEVEAKLKSGEGDKATLNAQRGAIMKKMEDQLSFKGENFDTISGKVKNQFLEKRYGADGYKEDFWLAVHAYSRAKNTKIHMENVVHDMAKVANNKADAGLKKWFDKQIDTVKGGKAELDKNFDNFLSDQMGLPKNAGTAGMVQARRLMSLAKIGYSLNSIVNSSMQLATIPGVLNVDGAMVGFLRTQKLLARLGSNTASDADRALWTKMHRHGIFEGDSQLIPDGAMSAIGKFIDTTAFAGIKGADRYMRVVTYLGAEHKGRNMGLSGPELDRYAWRMTNKANQNFSKLVAPQAFKSQVSKTMWSMMTFLPGTVVRSGEILFKGVKDTAVIGHSKLTGKPVTKAQYKQAVDSVSKAVFMSLSMAGMSALIGSITGNGEIVPNPLKKESWQTPVTNFIFGTNSQAGLMGVLPSSSDKLTRDENGNVVNEDHKKRVNQFVTETLPSFTIPGYAQAHRSIQGYMESQKGYGESANGNVQFINDKDSDIKRLLFGKYSTNEGQDYIKGLSTPEGGSLSSNNSDTLKGVDPQLRNQYYDFFKANDAVSGRTEANKEITQLYREGKVQQARRKAAEYNAKVDKALASFYNEYKFIDPDIQDKLNDNLYIKLTTRGEKQRTNSKDN